MVFPKYMNKNGSIANIREVYAISQRLEEKIDNLDKRVSNIEGKATIIAIVWSSILSVAGIITGIWIRR